MQKGKPALFALCLLTGILLLSPFFTASASAFENGIICEGEDVNPFGSVLERTENAPPIIWRRSFAISDLPSFYAAEVFDSLALPALEAGLATHWQPYYLATVVIAADRSLTDAKITSWRDLASSNLTVGMCYEQPYPAYNLAAISHAIDTKNGKDKRSLSFESATDLLGEIHRDGNLRLNEFDAPLIICFDYQAAAMIKSGRNLEIIIPSEGTLSFEKGLLSNSPIELLIDNSALISAGLRLLDGRCDSSIYPSMSEYSKAEKLRDYSRMNALFQQSTRIMRRDVQRVRLYSAADGLEHSLFALLYIIAVTLWSAAIARRALQKGIRRSVFLCSALIIGWTLMKLFKYQLPEADFLDRHIWYAYYLFMLAIPLVLLHLALVIDNGDPKGATLPKWWYGAVGLSGLCALLTLTNDLHKLAFVVDRSSVSWNTDYSYGPLYYLIAAIIFTELLLTQIILARKSRNSPRRHPMLFPGVFYLLLAVYFVAYAARLPIAWENDMTFVTGIFLLLFLETCLQIGFVPTNKKYAAFFRQSPQGMQILDSKATPALCSLNAPFIEEDIRKKLCENPGVPMQAGGDVMLFSGAVNGGTVIWQEDMSVVHSLNRKLEVTKTQLKAANTILEKEKAVLQELAAARARVALFAELEKDIENHSKRLSEMLHSLPSEGEERQSGMAKIAMLACYIKRRCNLFFLEQRGNKAAAHELNVYLDELAEFAGLTGIKCICLCSLPGNILLRHATLMYDYTHALLENMLANDEHELLIQIVGENEHIVLKAMISGDSVHFKPEAKLKDEIDAAGGFVYRKELTDVVGLWLSFPRNSPSPDTLADDDLTKGAGHD